MWKRAHYHMQNREQVGACCVTREVSLMPCDNREGRDGVGDGRGVHEEADMCMPGTDSC